MGIKLASTKQQDLITRLIREREMSAEVSRYLESGPPLHMMASMNASYVIGALLTQPLKAEDRSATFEDAEPVGTDADAEIK